VILHHLDGRGTMLEKFFAAWPDALHNLIRHGPLAVGTFFVLSGFVLQRSYASKTWTGSHLIRYGAARFARVYPVYALSLLLIAPIAFNDLFSSARAGLFVGTRGYLLTNYGLVLQGWAGKLPVSWNTPAWSLSCEFFFYLCFPVAALLLARMGRFGILVAGIAALAAPVWYRLFSVPAAWKPVIHLADFLAGIAAAALFEYLLRLRPSLARFGYLLYVPAAAAGVLVAAGLAPVPSYFDLNSALRPLNMGLLIGLAAGGGFPFRALSARVIVHFGQVSYSMYILHVPLLWWFRRFWFTPASMLSAASSGIVYLGGGLAASCLAYRVLEEPANRLIREWVDARLPRRPAR